MISYVGGIISRPGYGLAIHGLTKLASPLATEGRPRCLRPRRQWREDPGYLGQGAAAEQELHGVGKTFPVDFGMKSGPNHQLSFMPSRDGWCRKDCFGHRVRVAIRR